MEEKIIEKLNEILEVQRKQLKMLEVMARSPGSVGGMRQPGGPSGGRIPDVERMITEARNKALAGIGGSNFPHTPPGIESEGKCP